MSLKMLCSNCQTENDAGSEVCFTCGKPLAALTRGSLIAGRYEILEILGRGGMGIVFKAQDRMLDETVAIKVLRRELLSSPEMSRRFRSEIKLARRVTHPNVCRIHEYGEDEGINFISMAFLEGKNLRTILARHPEGLPAGEAFAAAVQVARGLQAIHEAGIIHRDLKAPNIMRDDRGVVRLMDFGIAKDLGDSGTAGLTAADSVLGTPEYMSPEQCRGERVDARCDVYALGVLVFELFTGQLPFRGDTIMATMLKHLQEPPPLEGPAAERLPPGVVALLRKALAKAPEDRYGSAEEFAAALERAQNASGQPDKDAPVPAASAPPGVPPEAAIPPLAASPAPAVSSKPDGISPAAESAAPETRQPAAGPPGTPPPAAVLPPPPPAGDADQDATVVRSRSRERRTEMRLEVPLNVLIKRCDPTGVVIQEERTIVDNLSRRGARVLTTMASVSIGEALLLEEIGGDFRTRAVIRNAFLGKDRILRLGIEFLDGQAPDRLVKTGDWGPSRRPRQAPDRLDRQEIRPPASDQAREPARSSTPPPSARAPAPTPPPPSARPAEANERRASSRLAIPLELVLKRLDPQGAVVQQERTIAENIGPGGAQVMTAMAGVTVGTVLSFEEVGGDFRATTSVRNIHTGSDGIRRLNLQFLEQRAPDRLFPTGSSAPIGRSGAAPRPDPPRPRTPAPQATPATPATPPPATPATPVPAVAAAPEAPITRQEVAEAFQGLKTRNHFDVLGIPRASTADAVRTAYRRLARRYHPDAITDRSLADLKPELNEIFVRIGEAYQTLIDVQRRARYEGFLGPTRNEPLRASAAPAQSPPPAPEVELPQEPKPLTPRAAEEVVAKARKLIDDGNPWDAIQALESALEVGVTKAVLRHQMQVLLARAVGQNPKWIKRSEELLLGVVAENDRHVEAYFELGKIYKARALHKRAQRMFQTVLELDPEHAGAREEVPLP